MIKKFFIFIICFSHPLCCQADYIATNTFEIDVDTTANVIISGNLTATLNGQTGVLGSSINVNYAITTNLAMSDIRLKALVKDANSADQCAFYCTGTSSTANESMYLVFGSTDNLPTYDSICNCRQATSSASDNPDAIAYPATLTIDNGGTVSYQSAGYFSCAVPTGSTNINLAVSTTPKSGTYDAVTSLDGSDLFKVEVYLDNIPS